MTRRERLEAKLERRRSWEKSRRAKAEAVHRDAEKHRGDHAFNTQPGHIPERARLNRRLDRAFEDSKMAEHHAAKASGLEAQLDRTIFSDDDDAIEKLEERIAAREEAARYNNRINAAWRKTTGTAEERAEELGSMGICSQPVARSLARTMALCPWLKNPVDNTNLRASIRRDRKRLAALKARRDEG